MTIKGVLFDKDGTLIDVHATWVPIYRAVLKDMLGLDEASAEAMMTTAGYDPERQTFRAGSVLAGGTTGELVDQWWPGLDAEERAARIHTLDHGYAHLVREKLSPLMPIEPILSELKAMGLLLGVGTNDTQHSARDHMAHIGVIEHFEDIIGADTVPVPKPSGNMIRRFAEITGLHVSEIAMVGDNHHDMEEARNGGAGLAIAVLSGNAAHEDIAHLADYTLDSVADLPALLRSL